MAGKISIPIEFEVARDSAAEVIQTLEKQLQKINPGTAIYDGIKKQITKASGLLEKVDKQFAFGYNTEGDISRTEKDFISLASAVDAVNASFKKIDASALNLNITEGEFGNIATQLKVVNTNLQQAQSNLQKLQSTKVKDLFDGRETKKIGQFTAEQKESSGLAVYEKIGQQMQDIGLQAADAEAKVQQLEKALAALQQTQNKKGYTDASTDAQHASAAKIYGLTGNSSEKVNDVRARVMEELKGAFKSDGSKKSTTDAIVTEILTAFEIDESEITAALTAKVSERQEKLRKIVYNLDESAGQGITSDKVKRARSKTHGMAKEYEGASALQQQIQNTSNELAGAQTESSNFESELASLTAAFQSLREKLYSKNIIGASGTVQDSDLSVEVEQLKAEVVQLQAQLTNQVRAGGGEIPTPTGSSGRENLNSLNEAEEFKRSLKDSVKQWIGVAQIVNVIKDGIRQAYSDIQGLDKAMTNIAVVTDMSISDLWGKINEYMSIAQQYGVTTQGVYEVSQLYYQQGLSTNEVMQATTETLKLARIAGMDYAEAADAMTVAIRSFKMEMSDAATVTDVYSKVAAITASDSEELAIAMSKTASSAESVGSSFENTTAMLAVMIETTRESA